VERREDGKANEGQGSENPPLYSPSLLKKGKIGGIIKIKNSK